MVKISWFKDLIDKFYALFMSNTLFLMSNILLLIVVFSIKYRLPSFIEIYIPILLLSPSMTALNYTIGKFFRYDDICVVRNYIYGYKMNFVTSIKTGTLIFTPIILGIYSIVSISTPLFYLQLIVVILLSIMTLYAFPILSRYHIKVKDLVILSFISVFKKCKLTLGLIMFQMMALIMFVLFPSISILFAFSTLVFMSMTLLNHYLETYET